MAELTGDEKMLKEANDALLVNDMLKREMWRKRKLARSYNLNYDITMK